MMMHDIQSLGYAAGILTTVASLPQALRILRTRQTRDISTLWAVAINVGTLIWLLYGIERGDWPMIVANTISLLLLMTILFLKLRYR